MARGVGLRPFLEADPSQAGPWRSWLVSESNMQGRMARSARWSSTVARSMPSVPGRARVRTPCARERVGSDEDEW